MDGRFAAGIGRPAAGYARPFRDRQEVRPLSWSKPTFEPNITS
jgi:hypothetical protein